MNNEIHSLKLPLGYQIIDKVKYVDLYTAYEILRSKKQRHITVAMRVDNNAQLISHVIKCPYCGKELPAYSHYWRKESHALPKKSKVEILNWADVQPSLYDEKKSVLEIQNYFGYYCDYFCENCGQTSRKKNTYIEVLIECVDDKVYVKREIRSLVELVSLKWFSTNLKINFPIYQQIVFDLDSGKTCMEITGGGNVVFSAEITNNSRCYKGDSLVDLLYKNRIVKRVLRRVFEENTGYKIPFSVNELDLEKFICLAKFKGFPKDFYYAIPYRGNTACIDGSFNNVVDKLRNPEFAMEYLRNSTLPFSKSVKKLFATKSGLFFYLRECELLYTFLNDVNLFCDYLQSSSAYNFLATAHYYDIRPFLEDYSSEMHKIHLKNILQNTGLMLEYAVKYSALNSYGKMQERKRWHQSGNMFCDIDCIIETVEKTLSVPMHEIPKNMGNCKVGKYFFQWLRTKREYISAGEQLQNCLVNWGTERNPVAVVIQKGEAVAAIEVRSGEIFQAKLKENKSIEPDSDLCRAIEKWCQINNIKFNPEKLADLPF